MKGKKANQSSNKTQLNPDTDTQRLKLTNRLSKEDLFWLKDLFQRQDSISPHLDDLYNFFLNKKLFFLNAISNKLQIDDLQEFLNSLTYITKQSGTKIIQQRKKSCQYYILLDGSLGLYYSFENDEEEIRVDEGDSGQLYCSFPYLSPRNSNYTAICQETCQFLHFTEEIYNRLVKKIHTKQVDEVIHFLKSNPVFDDVGTLNLRRFSSYFIKKYYKYHEMIYPSKSKVNFVYFILEGQVQLSKKISDNNLNVVKLGEGQCFGLEEEGKEELIHSAKNIAIDLYVLRINICIFERMKSEFPIIHFNLSKFLVKKNNVHGQIVNKNMKILKNKYYLKDYEKKKKKKKKFKEKKIVTAESLKWWGLAQNVPLEHKYKMPRSLKKDKFSSIDEVANFAKKINDLKKRVLDHNLKEITLQQQDNVLQKEKSPWKTTSYVPKMKAKVKMLQIKPKAVDMTEVIKKKLLTYAKNMGTFCDRLNLQ